MYVCGCELKNLITHKLALHAVPSVPVHPSATTVIGNPYELAISWQPPLEPNGILTVYNIYCLSTLGYDMKVITVGARIDRSSLFPGLRPYTVYSCFVSCNTSVGEGNVSQSVSARTDESSKLEPYFYFHFLYD